MLEKPNHEKYRLDTRNKQKGANPIKILPLPTHKKTSRTTKSGIKIQLKKEFFVNEKFKKKKSQKKLPIWNPNPFGWTQSQEQEEGHNKRLMV